ncbi:unnamed protein product [Cylindrotheca closterium]|uniref:Uncharacterized protein n=1 Tax=Cylindrotheca closterium TaxID=2856 RepID=A0AAD2G7M9_9STRA|nr:unnamed protein product [Cylindrotheca closterium]
MQSDRGVLQDRLNKIQNAVRQAQQETWKHQNPASALPNIKSHSASFQLGLTLFRDDVERVDERIRDKLEDVEKELNKLSTETQPNDFISQDSEDSPMIMLPMSTIGEGEADQGDNSDEDLLLQNDPQALQDEIELHRTKIAFLKQASLARTAINDSKTLSNRFLSPNSMDLLKASKLLVQANELLRQAESFASSLPAHKYKEGEEMEDNNEEREEEYSQEPYQYGTNIITSLRNEVRLERSKLLVTAGTILDQSVQLSPNSIEVKNSKQLNEAYAILEQFDAELSNRIMRETLRRFTKQLYQELLKPILYEHHGKKWKIEEKEEKALSAKAGVTTKGPVHRIDWTIVHGDSAMDTLNENSSAITPWKHTLDVLGRILVFCQSRILMNRQDPCEYVGAFLFGDPDAMPSELNLHAMGLDSTRIGADKGMLSEPILELIAKESLPDHYDFMDEDIVTLEDIASELKSYVKPFCMAMCQKWFIPIQPKPKLIDFCDKLPQKYIEHRRCILLDKAKDILVNNDYHNTEQVGITELPEGVEEYMSIFFMQSCSVSVTALKIVELVRETMEEVVQAADAPASLQSLRPNLYKTAREMFTLYRAVIPSKFRKEVKTVPRTAAVMHNDAVFFSHTCAKLGLEYKGRFAKQEPIEEDEMGPIMEQTFVFVDIVPVFRELALECLGDMLDFQKKQMVELIQPRLGYFAMSLKSNESLLEWSEAETALAAATYHLKHLQQAWQNILPKDVFAAAMGVLANVVFEAFLKALLVQDLSISPTANQFLASLFGKALKDIGEFFQKSKETPSQCCDEWDRFVCIAKFLETHSLPELKDSLAMGVFLHLTSRDVKIMLVACHKHQAYHPDYIALMNELANFGSQR